MLSTKETGELTAQMSSVAAELLVQLNGKARTNSELNRFFLGTLFRAKVMLHDASHILIYNEPHHLDTAFILFRSLLDDAVRVYAVHGTKDKDALLTAMNAEALSQIHASFVESAGINHRIYSGRANGLLRGVNLNDWKAQLKSSPQFATWFIDKELLKFKRMPQFRDLLQDINDKDTRDTIALIHVVYLRLSQYVHFSPFNFFNGRDAMHHQSIIGLLEECLIYVYRLLRIHFEYFREQLDMQWVFPDIDKWFMSVTEQSKA